MSSYEKFLVDEFKPSEVPIVLKNRKAKIDRDGLVRLPFPAEIAIETHGYCNFKCIVCPYPTLERKKVKMEMWLYQKIIDEVARESPYTRLWLAIMGEPLMDKKIIPRIRYANEHGARRVHLNTNGTFLEGALAEELLQSGVESVYVAIDAINEETFNKVRPGGDFNRVKRNLENFLKLREKNQGKGPEIVAQFIVMDENASEIDQFHDYWLKQGAVVKLRLRQGWGQEISTPDLDKIALERIPCPWLVRTMNIHWTGHVTQCDPDYEEHYPAGDLNHQSIKEVWGGELAHRREHHWTGNFSHPLCVDCKDWSSGRADFDYPNENAKKVAPRWSPGEPQKHESPVTHDV